MINYNIDVLGIAEARWTGFGHLVTSDKHLILYSGDEEKHERGVALILSEDAGKNFIDWKLVNSRIIRPRFYSRHIKLTVIQTCAPTNGTDFTEKEEYYEQLQSVLNETNKHDIIILMGDMNAKVSKRVSRDINALGNEACGASNENVHIFGR